MAGALADYIDLRLAVAEHVDRRDISDVMPRMVLAAEASLNKKLRCREMVETGFTLTFTDGVAPLPDGITTPPDPPPGKFLQVITLWDATNNYPLSGGVQASMQNTQDAYGYAIAGTNIYIYGLTGDRLLDYYAALPTLTTSVTTSNWLLAKSPDLYLYAVSLEVAKWLKNVELAQATDELLQRELRDLQRADTYETYGGSTVRMRAYLP